MNQILVTEKIYVTPELKEKKKIYKIEFFLSIILICLFSSYYIHAAYDRDKSEEVSQMILTEIKDDNIKEYCDNDPIIIILDDNLSNNKQKEEKLEKEIYIDNVIYPIESIIKIPKIGINYPVISKTSEELLKISVNKFHGPNPNEVGNFCIVGHNYRNSRFFSKVPNLVVGDIVKLKKQHPCGSNEWEILRVGADFRLKCMGCGHQIMVPRKMVEKNTKNLQKKEK